MSIDKESIEKADKLAQDVLRLSRNTLLVNLRFLDMALSSLEYIPEGKSIAVDGEHIFYDPMWVLKRYKGEKEAIVRDYLHMVFHCIFHHAFVDTLLDTDAWDVACDIAAENAINELDLPCVRCAREAQQNLFMKKIRQEVKLLTAEKIYHYLREKNISGNELIVLRQNFIADDHTIWYLPPEPAGNGKESPDEHTKQRKISGGQAPADGNGDDDGEKENKDGDNGNNDGDNENKDKDNSNRRTTRTELEQAWKDIAQRMQTDLETFSKQRGDTAGNLTQNLQAVTREKYDYSDFLRRFAVMGEAMKVNDDEFDYIFYTYGMKLYEKMPLIEPLEYKDVKRIKEFVIAIDTSGSVEGELVQTFLQKTYNILKQEESFFTKINLHIIQCDAEIQEDAKITTQEEFDDYLKKMELRGFGGTDFRPVFGYVDWLREKKEFVNLKGLIYFTDGYGVFPEQKPDYETAFVFIDDDYGNPDVPPWAIKLVLQKDEI